MPTKSYPKNEFKKILKGLFTERKQEGAKENFQEKVKKLHILAREEEFLQIKASLAESEQQRQILQSHIDKSKPALQKLHQDCQELQKKITEKERLLQESQDLTAQLQGTIKKQGEKWAQEKALMEKKQEKMHSLLLEGNEEKELLQGNYEKLEKAFKQNQRLFREQSEEQLAEMHILQQKLATLEHQLRQTDMAKICEEYEEKIAQCTLEHKTWVAEVRAERDVVMNELAYMKKNAQEWMEKSKYLEAERETILISLKEKNQLLLEKEEAAALLHKNVKELMQKVEENKSEVHKAQLHLAKKVKESALFQDVAQKQKEQLLEEQKKCAQEREWRLQLEKSIENYQQNETQLKFFTKQCAQEAESAVQKWEERVLQLQEEVERQQVKLMELEKYQASYEKLLAIVKGT